MFTVVMETATQPTSLLPLLVVLVAAILLVSAILLLRYRRKGDK
jgi:hypothetical protein